MGRDFSKVPLAMSGNQPLLTYPLMKWTLFSLLILTAPSLLFLVVAFMIMPAIFFAAGILYMIPKTFSPSQASETLAFIGFFAVHLLIYIGFYLLISVIAAKLIFLIGNSAARNTLFALLCLAVVSLTLFPVYGSGGHSGVEWRSLLGFFEEVNREYGPYTLALVYGTYFLCLAAVLFYGRRRRKRTGSEKQGA